MRSSELMLSLERDSDKAPAPALRGVLCSAASDATGQKIVLYVSEGKK